jgi:hypothetical protein
LDQTPSTVTRVPLGQAKLGNLDGAVFLPDAGIEEDSGDVFELVACTLTEVVCEAEAGDQLAGLCLAQLRVFGETADDCDVDTHSIPPLGLGRFVPPWYVEGPGIRQSNAARKRRKKVFEGAAARLGGRNVCSAALAASGAA